MSATPPADPKDPKDAKKAMTSAVIFAVLALAFAGYMLWDAGRVDTVEKRNFRYVAGGIGVIVAAINGYSAWTQSQKAKQPPSK